MVNKKNNYLNGRQREYREKRKMEAKGFKVIRASGSHGFADLVCIHPNTGSILFIQCKPKSMSDNARKKIEEENSWVNGTSLVKFEVR